MGKKFQIGIKFKIKNHKYGLWLYKTIDKDGKLIKLDFEVCDYKHEENLEDTYYDTDDLKGVLTEEQWIARVRGFIENDINVYCSDDKPTSEELVKKLLEIFDKTGIDGINEEV